MKSMFLSTFVLSKAVSTCTFQLCKHYQLHHTPLTVMAAECNKLCLLPAKAKKGHECHQIIQGDQTESIVKYPAIITCLSFFNTQIQNQTTT
eukprot:15143066-Ditylum_brightwellii.AAC.1